MVFPSNLAAMSVYLNLGCRDRLKGGFINVDVVPFKGVDVVADLERGMPFKDGSVDHVFASHVIEHLAAPDRFMRELHRVLKKRGTACLLTPHYSSTGAYRFTHKCYFSLDSFSEGSLNEEFMYGENRPRRFFRVKRLRWVLDRKPAAFLRVLHGILNLAPCFFEKFLHLGGEINVEIEKA